MSTLNRAETAALNQAAVSLERTSDKLAVNRANVTAEEIDVVVKILREVASGIRTVVTMKGRYE